MSYAETVKPDEVSAVLLKGEDTWREVTDMQPIYWRLDDGTKSDRGRRGWILTLPDGEEVFATVSVIEAVR